MAQDHVYDLAILGAGPGGLTAAVYASRKQLDVVMITGDIGGQTNLTQDIENYMGFRFISGQELADKFREQVEQFPIKILLGKLAEGIRQEDKLLRIAVSGEEEVVARTVIVATGKRSRTLGVPGEKELVGRGISFCSICDAPFFRDQRVAVIGGGNSGITAVVDLLKVAREITVIEITDTWRADPVLIERARASEKVRWLAGHRVVRIEGTEEVTGIVVAPTAGGPEELIELEGVFLEIGLQPNTDFLKGFVELNEYGEIVIDARCRTSVPGVFAAGDVSNTPEKQIIVAAGEGAKAALGVYQYLLGVEDVRQLQTW
jgi:alkyl hydroperoxide reductase subunit F